MSGFIIGDIPKRIKRKLGIFGFNAAGTLLSSNVPIDAGANTIQTTHVAHDAADLMNLATFNAKQNFKESVVAVSVANTSLVTLVGTIDGQAKVVGQRYLLTVQTTPAEEGIWVAAIEGQPWTRPTDWATGSTQVQGVGIPVELGTTYVNSIWTPNTTAVVDADDPDIDLSSISKVYIDAADALKVAKAGDTMTGDLNMGSSKVISSATAINPHDLVNLETMIAGRTFDPVNCNHMPTTAITGTWTYSVGKDTLTRTTTGVIAAVDGVTIATPASGTDIICVNWFTAALSPQNGFYLVTTNAAGSNAVLTRTADWPVGKVWAEDTQFGCELGTTYYDTLWTLHTAGVVGTDDFIPDQDGAGKGYIDAQDATKLSLAGSISITGKFRNTIAAGAIDNKLFPNEQSGIASSYELRLTRNTADEGGAIGLYDSDTNKFNGAWLVKRNGCTRHRPSAEIVAQNRFKMSTQEHVLGSSSVVDTITAAAGYDVTDFSIFCFGEMPGTVGSYFADLGFSAATGGSTNLYGLGFNNVNLMAYVNGVKYFPTGTLNFDNFGYYKMTNNIWSAHGMSWNAGTSTMTFYWVGSNGVIQSCGGTSSGAAAYTIAANSAGFCMGLSGNYTNESFNGQTMLFNAAKNATAFRDFWNDGEGNDFATYAPADCISKWQVDEGTGVTIADEGTAANNFTINGTSTGRTWVDITTAGIFLNVPGLVIEDSIAQDEYSITKLGAPLSPCKIRGKSISIYQAIKNPIIGLVTMNGVTAVPVVTNKVTANSVIRLSIQDANAGTPATVLVDSITAGTGFSVVSLGASDASTVLWELIEIESVLA
jgi:hypothetical protein